MFFDLNNTSFDTNVFNNANAGKVENVKLSVERREPGTNQPHVKLVFQEANGSKVNSGIFINDKDHTMTEEAYNTYLKNRVIRRIYEATKAVVPENYVFPPTNNLTETIDVLIDTINQFAPENPVNVYVTYGTKERPSKYLSPRFFNFIERAGTTEAKSRLVPAGGDNIHKFVESTSDEEVMNGMNLGTNVFTSPNSAGDGVAF